MNPPEQSFSAGPWRWVFLEQSPWDSRQPSAGRSLAQILLRRGHQVAYVASPVFALLHDHSARQSAEMVEPGAIGRWRNDKLFTFTPRTWMPVGHRWPMDSKAAWNASELFTRPRAGEILREVGFARTDVLVAGSFSMPHIIRQLQPRVLVVRLDGDPSCDPGNPRIVAQRSERLISDADLVTVTTESLSRVPSLRWAERIHLLPPGIDSSLCERPGKLPVRPKDLPPGPVALCFGPSGDGALHQELLEAAARDRPDWSFALFTNPAALTPSLLKKANVHVLRLPPLEERPHYLWHADAGILPYRRTRFTESWQPPVLTEYLAAGLPVVATRWSQLEKLGAPVTSVDTMSEFCRALDDARRITPSRRGGLVEWARGFDWVSICSGFEDVLADVMSTQEREIAS